jgi:drug/metabolite transporter (DMT)-like permease
MSSRAPSEDGRPAAGAAARLAPLLLAAAAAFWAGNFVTGRAFGDVLPPTLLNAARWLVALALLLPWTARDLVMQRALLLRHAPLLVALGATGVAGFQTFVYRGLADTPVVSAVLIVSTVPVVIPLLAFLLFRQRIRRTQAIGLTLSLAGALFVIARGDPLALLDLRGDVGALWMVAAVPTWALYSVLLMRVPKEMPPRTLLTATTLTGLLVLFPFALWSALAGERLMLTPATGAAILYIGTFASVLAFLAWNRGVALIGPTRAGLFMHLMPLFGAVLSYLFLGESLATYHAAGAALVVAGLVVASRQPPTT